MSARTWKANVRLTNGLHQEVYVVADSQLAARAMIEAMYGSGCILQGPWERRGLECNVRAVTAIFGPPLLIAGAMIDPQGLHLRGLLTYTGIMVVLLPVAGGWQLLVTQLVVPTAGRSRVSAVFNLWIGGTLLGVAAISFIASVLDYPRPDTDHRRDPATC